MSDLHIRAAQHHDVEFLSAHDRHVSTTTLQKKIADAEILIATNANEPVGFLRWGWFWDNTPFMNLLFVVETWRGKGFGTHLADEWEEAMRGANVEFVLTSTLAHETAQHFYRKRGYQDIGGFVLPLEPIEIILYKALH